MIGFSMKISNLNKALNNRLQQAELNTQTSDIESLLTTTKTLTSDLQMLVNSSKDLANSVPQHLQNALDESQKATSQALALQQIAQTASLSADQLTNTLTQHNTKVAELTERTQANWDELHSQLQALPTTIQTQTNQALQESIKQNIQAITDKIHRQFTQEFSQETLKLLDNLLNEQTQAQIQNQIQTIAQNTIQQAIQSQIAPLNQSVEEITNRYQVATKKHSDLLDINILMASMYLIGVGVFAMLIIITSVSTNWVWWETVLLVIALVAAALLLPILRFLVDITPRKIK